MLILCPIIIDRGDQGMQNRALRICQSPVDLGMGRIRGESTDVSVPDESVYTSEQMLENRENLPISATFGPAPRDLPTPVLARQVVSGSEDRT
jgi:hypothetical protein